MQAGETSSPDGIGFSKGRFEALTDGIFAISMTLLVVGMAVPTATTITTSDGVVEILVGLLPDLLHYLIAFFILHSMWVSHHFLSQRMASINRTFLDLNLLLLMATCLIPFTTSFVGDYSDIPVAAIVFETSLLIVGGVLMVQWLYVARSGRLLRPGVRPGDLSQGMWITAVTPAVSLLGIILALAGVTWSTAVYLLIPPLIWVIRRA